MNNTQFYLTMFVPTVAVLIGILVNAAWFVSLNARVNSLETRITNLETEFHTKLDLIIGKIAELSERIARLEERMHL